MNSFFKHSISVTIYAESDIDLTDKIKISLIEIPKKVDMNVKVSLKRLSMSEIERLQNATKVMRTTNYLLNYVLIK